MTALTGTDKPPSKRALHLLADYAELRCAASESGAFSAEEFQDARKRADQDAEEDQDDPTITDLFLEDEDVEGEELDEVTVDMAFGDADETASPLRVAPADADDERVAGVAAADDARELESADVIQHLEYRIATFGEAYPFRLRDDAVLELLEDLTPERQLYLFLLIASNLKYVRSGQRKQELTTFFEVLGVDVLRGYLGEHARVELFGTSSTAVEAPRFSGSLWEKLQALGLELRGRVVPTSEHQVVNAGDFGIDLVAWFAFDDDLEGRFVTILGQCACGRSWPPKMREPTAEALVETITFTAPVVNVLLVPYCWRTAEGAWYSLRGVPSGVLLDRQRIVQAIATAGAGLPVGAFPGDVVRATAA